jgi:hypothetical protein
VNGGQRGTTWAGTTELRHPCHSRWCTFLSVTHVHQSCHLMTCVHQSRQVAPVRLARLLHAYNPRRLLPLLFLSFSLSLSLTGDRRRHRLHQRHRPSSVASGPRTLVLNLSQGNGSLLTEYIFNLTSCIGVRNFISLECNSYRVRILLV